MISEETRKKLSESRRGEKNHMFGKHPTEETRKKNSDAIKELWKNPDYRRRITEANIGKKYSDETRKKVSDAVRGRKPSDETRKKISEVKMNPSEEVRQKHSNAAKRQFEDPEQRRIRHDARIGSNHPMWKGGVSFLPYCPKFNEDFKERVRAFFGYICQFCGTPQNGRKLAVHHVNFNKDSCCDPNAPRLFIPLCHGKCHMQTNINRPFWEQYFTDMIMGYYQGKCYFTEKEMLDITDRTA